MTIIFSKRTGDIKYIFSGNLQHIDTLFGVEGEDYKLIWDEICIADDNYVLENPKNFKVNTETKTLEILQSAVTNYPIAAQ